jgi:hypothetical protein
MHHEPVGTSVDPNHSVVAILNYLSLPGNRYRGGE